MEWQKDILFAKAQQILKEAEKLGASQAEVTIVLADTALTRLANSIIDQNVSDRRSMVNIHLYYGKQ
ncbi:MAG: hypothetical protein P1Q69_17460, partial [Candidatus Thorarchaeota archaeon]|nr:hypothetical protein [Candidatus Thorarchaeota archaeon]